MTKARLGDVWLLKHSRKQMGVDPTQTNDTNQRQHVNHLSIHLTCGDKIVLCTGMYSLPKGVIREQMIFCLVVEVLLDNARQFSQNSQTILIQSRVTQHIGQMHGYVYM